jgi:Ca2+-binding RTX toxin-like protein
VIGGKGFDFGIFGSEDPTVSIQVDLALGSAMGQGTDTFGGVEGVVTGGGDDTVSGDGLDNVFVGSSGDDSFEGRGGDDTLAFSTGYASAYTPSGVSADLGSGSASGQGSDVFTSIEDLVGTSKPDTLTGDAGPNTIFAKGGTDTLSGLAGDDVLNGGLGVDTGEGGAQITGDVCVSIEVPTSCELTS